MKNKDYSKYIFILLTILVLVFLIYNFINYRGGSFENQELGRSYENDLDLYFFDVGQGDSAFIRLPNGENMLIDGGTRSMGDRVVSNLRGLGVETIDYLVASHPHEDHIGGLIKVVDNFQVREAYLPRKTSTTKTYENFLLSLKEGKVRVIEAKKGVNILGEEDLTIDILGPKKEYKSTNDNSVVLKISYKEFTSLFTGDMEILAEKEVLKDGFNLESQLIKLAHHGSNTSSSEEFLRAVRPELAIISLAKDNKYKHPNQEVLDRLSSLGSKFLRTDESGNILIKSDGHSYRIKEHIKLD